MVIRNRIANIGIKKPGHCVGLFFPPAADRLTLAPFTFLRRDRKRVKIFAMRRFSLKWTAIPLAALLALSCGEVNSDSLNPGPAFQDIDAIATTTQTPLDNPALRSEVLKLANTTPPPVVYTLVPSTGLREPQTKTYEEVITEGVIEDYVTIVRFMDARAKMITALPRASDPDAPSVLDIKNREASRIIFHKYQGPTTRAPLVMTQPGKAPVTLWNMCNRECPKLILGKFTDSVAYVTHDTVTGNIIPESVIEYGRSETCNEMSYGSPPLGLCINGTKPDKTEIITGAEGVHIYDKAASPYWPKGFGPDLIHIPDQIRAMEKFPPAFAALPNVEVSNNTLHRALGLKRTNKPEVRYIAHDFSCIQIRPALPGGGLRYLATEALGEDSTLITGSNKSYYSSICIGQNPNDDERTLFRAWESQDGNFDYSASISPHEIARNLSATYWQDPEKNGGRVKAVITQLQNYHPEFQTTIGYDVAPIVIDLAKRDLGLSYRNNSSFKILQRMPHESMAAYGNDLAQIVEDTAASIGCVGLECSKDLKNTGAVLGKLSEIFNGAGPGAGEYLDRIYLANQKSNQDTYHKSGWGPIGGLRSAAACIGHMGPGLETAISQYAYRRTNVRDNKFTFTAEQSLKMTDQSEKARLFIENNLVDMIEKSKDPELSPKAYKTQELMRSIARTKKILKDWTNEEPYCPSRPVVIQ